MDNSVADPAAFRLPSLRSPLQHITVYECASAYYLHGTNRARTVHKLMTVDRTAAGAGAPVALPCSADEAHSSRGEMAARITALQAAEPGLKIVAVAYGLVGFIRLLEGYHMMLITRRRRVGLIGGHVIYAVDKTVLLPVHHRPQMSKDDLRYRSIIEGFDLTASVYFSYTYDMTNTVEKIMAAAGRPGATELECNEMFVWNANLIRELVGVVPPTDWVIPLIHGFFRQVLFELDGGRSVSLTLLARRSRHFAGTRYLRRGVNWHGFVANEVETEQIVTDADGESYGKGVLTSLVQVRGSIPLFWQHTNLMSPKPGIVLDPCDPSYIATRAHFHRLKCRYGDGIVVLSLINQVDGHRETKLGEAFTHVVSVLNASPGEASADSTATATGVESGDEQGGGETKRNDIKDKGGTGDTDDANGTDGADGTEGAARTEKGIRTDSIYMSNGSELCPSEPLMYITFDFAACSKSTTQNVIEAVSAVSDSMQSKIGFFRTSRPVGKGNGSSWSEGVQAVRQAGILRSNCIDCLDRTNVAQFCLGRSSLPSQFAALGVRLREEQFDIVWTKLMDAFATHGDEMARQYGGSGAMHRIALEGGGSARASGSAESDSNASQPKAAVTGGVKNALVATKRYLANNLSDPLKQQGLDLFLGVYRCEPGKQALWDSAQVNEKGAIEIASGAGAPCAGGTDGVNATDTDRSVSSTDDNIGLTVVREFDDAVPTREIERGGGGEKTEAKSEKRQTEGQARAGALGCFYDAKYELDCLTSFDGIMEKRNERVRINGPSLSSLEVAVSSLDDASSTISDDPGSPHSGALESNGALQLDAAPLLLDPLPFVASGGDSNCNSAKSARAAYEQYVGGTASFGPASSFAPSQPTTRTSRDSGAGAHGASAYGAEFDEDDELRSRCTLGRDTIDSESSFSVCHDDEKLGSVGVVGGGGRQTSNITPSSPTQNRVDRADKSSEEQGNLPSARHTGKGIFSRLFGRKKHPEVPRSEEPSGGYGGGEPTPRVARVSEDNMPSSPVSLDDVEQFSTFADQMRRLELLNVATDERLRFLTLLCERQELSCTAMQAMVAKDVIPPTQDSKPAAVSQRRVGGALFTQLDRTNNQMNNQ